jgi:hypothetical protein
VTSEFAGMPTYDDLRLTRLDLARDIVDVRSIPQTLWAISQLPVQRARTDRLERGARGAWQTLTRGNIGRWLSVSYDKSEELFDKARRTYDVEAALLLRTVAAECSGRQRWELQMRRSVLLSKGITSVHVDQEEMFRMSEQYFDRTRFGDVVGGTQRLFDALDSLSPAEQRGVMCVLIADRLGRRPPYSHNPADDYRLLARRLSLSAADLLADESEPRRLDFSSGKELVGDEAMHASIEAVSIAD